MNGLLSLLAGLGGQDAPTDVEGVVSVAPKKKAATTALSQLTSPAALLDNSSDIEALNKQQASSPSIQRPKSTLRDVIGLLGDAFVMNEGGKAIYAPSIDSRRISEAGAGFTNNPAGAAERLMGLGIDGTPELGNTIYNNAQTATLKRDIADNTAAYREAGLAQKTAGNVTKLMPYVGPLLSGAKDKDDYALRWQRVQQMAAKQGLRIEDLGVPDPEDWSPEVARGFGATTGALINDENADLTRAQGKEIADDRIAATERGQDVSRANANTRAGVTTRGQDIAHSDRAAALQTRRDLAKTAKTPEAKKAISKLKPAAPRDIEYLKKNPKLAADFDKKFGAGAAKAYAGIK